MAISYSHGVEGFTVIVFDGVHIHLLYAAAGEDVMELVEENKLPQTQQFRRRILDGATGSQSQSGDSLDVAQQELGQSVLGFGLLGIKR